MNRPEAGPRFYIASLGCPKNTVDSSGMAVLLQRAGYEPTQQPQEADYVIVNTCGFIGPARAESLGYLQELVGQSRDDQKVIAAGCWAQREPEKLLDLVPGLDAVIGTRTWHALPALLAELQRRPERLIHTEQRRAVLPEEAGAPGYALSGSSAFLKIAEGCSRRCAFCAIPLIKGPTVSRSVEAVLEDAVRLQELGVLEINLIAQDSTFYGYDLGLQDGLALLLEKLVERVPNVPWLRVLYAFPGYVTPRFIEVMAEFPQVLPYVDIPLQHAHPEVLRRMRRPPDVDEVRRTVDALRERMPEVCLRTTFIVGYPGETEEEFLALLNFIENLRFDRVGVFKYSHEVGTPAAVMKDDVPEEVKAARLDALMVAQQRISLEKNRDLVGQELTVLLEGVGDGLTVGRSYRDAPEIDGLVLISQELEPHRLIRVRVSQAMVYDLVARPVDETQSGSAG
ncbi:MAG: 30S ribosomal protein S12 methylthiotransferase RimO [Anaerolineales bacterium]